MHSALLSLPRFLLYIHILQREQLLIKRVSLTSAIEIRELCCAAARQSYNIPKLQVEELLVVDGSYICSCSKKNAAKDH